MDYEKAYKEAFKRASNLHKDAIDMDDSIRAKQCEIIFPELKESEDEKIRKELLEHCKNQAEPYILTGNKCPQIQSWISWLENQGQNPAWTEEDEEMFFGIIADIQFRQKTHNHEVIPDVYEREIDWLKSLKERVQPQWKPEDVHLEALRCVINGNNFDVVALKDLLEQLKKL